MSARPLTPTTTLAAVREEDPFWEGVYAGDIVRFARPAGFARIVRAGRRLARRAFGTDDPRRAHLLHPRDEFFRRASAAQAEFRADPAVARTVAETLEEIGLDARDLHRDTVELRIAPPVGSHGGGVRSHVGAHRDLWGVAITQQVNWWGPAWPLARRRTFAFYPEYWDRPLENTTATWSVRAYLDARNACPPGVAPPYPSAPQPVRDPETPPRPVSLPVGDLLCFSSAHLHASVPNTTALTRFSVEWRTVRVPDVLAGRGSPNVDCATARPAFRIFSGVTDQAPLGDLLAK